MPDTSTFTGIENAARIAGAYCLPEIRGIAGLADPAGIHALGKAHRSALASFRIGSLAKMIGSQNAIAAFAPTLGVMKNDALAHMLEGVRAQQSVFQSAIGAYMDQQRAQAERITGMIDALAIPRFDPATLGIGSALSLAETSAFKIAGLTPDYAEQFDPSPAQ